VEKANGELVREVRIPVAAQASRDPQRYNLTGVAAPGGPTHLILSLLAENRQTASQPARLDQQLLHDSLGQLDIVRLDEAAVSIQWRPGQQLVSYTLTCRSDNPLDPPRSHTTPLTAFTWSGLAPNTAYTFAVYGNKAEGGGRTPVSSVRVKTQGPSLPTPNLTVADLVPNSATSVKLSWSLPAASSNSSSSSSLSYGVWFDASEEELLSGGPRSLVDLGATTWTVRNLTACTSYIFAVAVLLKGPGDTAGGAIGAAGPRSNYRTVTTKFSPVSTTE
jgi:chitodextrinase